MVVKYLLAGKGDVELTAVIVKAQLTTGTPPRGL
jgi:hypothetical protein